ncbi:hypothetical protein H0H92_002688 [Tricholoma furcatifolium]|nr:hypothetical protein H0H92_002688 [Tricholoma furcatifolium]
MSHPNDENAVNEETALLAQSSKRPRANPLPWFQISIVLLLQVAEPLTSLSIYPYINQLVSELDITGGDKRKVGYYAGLIVRIPLLCYRSDDCPSMESNVRPCVMKSVMGDLTDSTNRAEGFSLMPVVWATGATLGPLVGGSLSKPAERFPDVFGAKFWKEYPYFLPCLVPAAFVLVAFLVTLVFFKETVPKKNSRTSSLSEAGLGDSNDGPMPLRKILVYPVILSVSNYMSLAFLNIALNALLPLFFAMPLTIGGLGFDPATIGYILGFYGVCTGVFQALYFSKIIRRVGERGVFVAGIASFAPIFALFPIISIAAQHYGVTGFTWACIALMLFLMIIMDMAFGCIFMFITASTPSKRSLGATNGLSQTAVSIIRTIGPAMATSLFSASQELNLLWGYAVYAILFVLTLLAICLALCLPHQMWPEAEE